MNKTGALDTETDVACYCDINNEKTPTCFKDEYCYVEQNQLDSPVHECLSSPCNVFDPLKTTTQNITGIFEEDCSKLPIIEVSVIKGLRFQKTVEIIINF